MQGPQPENRRSSLTTAQVERWRTMSHEEAAMEVALQRLGIAVTQDMRPRRGWGWSMQNDKIIRPWVGPYATCADATAAALDWVLDQTWRGVLHPILHAAAGADDRHAAASTDDRYLGPSGDDLLVPWLRAFQRDVLADEVRLLGD